jgi:toxin ParE1/3/4
MPSEIVWLLDAVRDVARLKEFIQKKNPSAAQRAANRISDAIKILIENPEAGKPVQEAPFFRDLFIPFGSGSYILRYREEPNRVVIVRVRFSKEDGF